MTEHEDSEIRLDVAACFRGWERLRLPYSGVVLVAVLWKYLPTIGTGYSISVAQCIVQTVVVLLFANVLFFLGPACEAYARWLRFTGRFRVTAFIVLTALVAFAAWHFFDPWDYPVII